LVQLRIAPQNPKTPYRIHSFNSIQCGKVLLLGFTLTTQLITF